MKRIFFCTMLSWMCCVAIAQQQQGYLIEGKAPLHLEGEGVMLFTFCKDEVLSVDTTVVRNGKFSFEGDCWVEELSVLTIGNYPDTVRSVKLMLEPGVIKVLLDTSPHIEGTLLNDKYQVYLDNQSKLEDIYQAINENMHKGLSVTELEEELLRYPDIVEFITENISNPLGVELFKKSCESMAYQEFFAIYESLDEQLRSDPKVIRTYDSKLKRKEEYESRTKLQGLPMIDFTLQTPEGTSKKMSDFLPGSEYVLFEFWASWCGPCIDVVEYIKDVHEKYKEKGLKVVGISLDTRAKDWQSAIQNHGLEWDHLCNLDGGENIKSAYNFGGIPYSLLVDKSGTIILTGYPAQGLMQMMDHIFGYNAGK